MSYLAQKKAQQKLGPHHIMYYIGATFFIAAGINSILYWIIDFVISGTSMFSVLYFLFAGGLTMATGSYISENEQETLKVLKNWLITLIAASFLIGIAYGSYMW
jgi:hypothetical protein